MLCQTMLLLFLKCFIPSLEGKNFLLIMASKLLKSRLETWQDINKKMEGVLKGR